MYIYNLYIHIISLYIYVYYIITANLMNPPFLRQMHVLQIVTGCADLVQVPGPHSRVLRAQRAQGHPNSKSLGVQM